MFLKTDSVAFGARVTVSKMYLNGKPLPFADDYFHYTHDSNFIQTTCLKGLYSRPLPVATMDEFKKHVPDAHHSDEVSFLAQGEGFEGLQRPAIITGRAAQDMNAFYRKFKAQYETQPPPRNPFDTPLKTLQAWQALDAKTYKEEPLHDEKVDLYFTGQPNTVALTKVTFHRRPNDPVEEWFPELDQ